MIDINEKVVPRMKPEVSPEVSPWKILIIDDDPDIHLVTLMTLKRLVFQGRPVSFIHAYSAAEGLDCMREYADIAVALLDVVMETDSAGLDIVRSIREDLNNTNIRLIIRTGVPGSAPEEQVTLDYDINDYQSKIDLTAQKLRTVIVTALRSYQALVTIQTLNKEIDTTQKELIYTLGEIAESRSIDTSYHVKRVGLISGFIAEKMGYLAAEVDRLELSASMHDLGKLAIDDRILNKPGALTPEEFEAIKNHSVYGYEILKNSSRTLLREAATIAHEHHENFDGTGYPQGLKGEEIDLNSRIVAVVDVFDALATKRVYKAVWPQNEIIEFLVSQRGKKFDSKIVDVLLAYIDEINELIRDLVV